MGDTQKQKESGNAFSQHCTIVSMFYDSSYNSYMSRIVLYISLKFLHLLLLRILWLSFWVVVYSIVVFELQYAMFDTCHYNSNTTIQNTTTPTILLFEWKIISLLHVKFT